MGMHPWRLGNLFPHRGKHWDPTHEVLSGRQAEKWEKAQYSVFQARKRPIDIYEAVLDACKRQAVPHCQAAGYLAHLAGRKMNSLEVAAHVLQALYFTADEDCFFPKRDWGLCRGLILALIDDTDTYGEVQNCLHRLYKGSYLMYKDMTQLPHDKSA